MTIAGQRRVEPVVYPSTDHMGEHELQRFISDMLSSLLQRYFKQRRVVAHVGCNTFIYWEEGTPKTTIAPDMYVLPNVEQDIKEPCWKLWELDGVRPSFALEVVSGGVQKDYEEAPGLYAAMGCAELVIYDPHATPRSRKRVRWQHYKRDARGAFRKVAVRAKHRVWVASLGVWLREVVGPRDLPWLRLGLGDLGNELLLTADEAARASDEARRVTEAENARLRAELAALHAATKKPSP